MYSCSVRRSARSSRRTVHAYASACSCRCFPWLDLLPRFHPYTRSNISPPALPRAPPDKSLSHHHAVVLALIDGGVTLRCCQVPSHGCCQAQGLSHIGFSRDAASGSRPDVPPWDYAYGVWSARKAAPQEPLRVGCNLILKQNRRLSFGSGTEYMLHTTGGCT